MKTATLTLNQEQLSYLEEALGKAMDNEGDAEYYEAFNELFRLTLKAVDELNKS